MDDDGGDEDCGAFCCICFVCLLILVPPITILSLSLTPHSPKLYVRDFFIPALNNNPNARSNTFIFIDLQFRNVMPFNGVRYEGLKVTCFYGWNRSFPVASYALPGFYQGFQKTAHKRAVVRTRGLPWGDAFDRVSRGLAVDFAVELAMTVKLRRGGTYMKKKAVVAAVGFSLDGSTGELVDNKVIRLRFED